MDKPGIPTLTWTRSMGVKLLAVCGLAFLMSVPAVIVSAITGERARRAADVTSEIARHVGGSQTVLGPTLAIPYSIPSVDAAPSPFRSTYILFPAHGSATLHTATEERHRSLFRVPVYKADVNFSARCDLTNVPAALPPGAELEWDRANLIIGISDPRGALSDATATVGAQALTLEPTDVTGSFPPDADSTESKLVLFGVHVGKDLKPGSELGVSSTLHFSGAQAVSILAYGKTTELTASGDWKSPGFEGGILPLTRSVSDHGFSASWSVPFIGRGVRAEGPLSTISGLNATALGISFVELADPYQSVNRSLKYALLFVGVVFLCYFVFEVSARRRVHAAQYVLVGIAQAIFYLLLLSFAERLGFGIGFLIAGSATVALLSINAAWVFASRVYGLIASAVFSVLYSLIYLLLRLEDNALLVGAVASFLAVGVVMYLTRGINWYGTLQGSNTAGKERA